MTSANGLKVRQPVFKSIALVLLAAGLLLLVPLAAMQFTDQVAWDWFDFAVAGALLAGTGVVYVVWASQLRLHRHRVIVGIALAAALALVWIELAVGIFGTPLSGS